MWGQKAVRGLPCTDIVQYSSSAIYRRNTWKSASTSARNPPFLSQFGTETADPCWLGIAESASPTRPRSGPEAGVSAPAATGAGRGSAYGGDHTSGTA
jgi:hypothetical protein